MSLAVWMGGVTHEINRLLDRHSDGDHSAAWGAILAAPSHQSGQLKRERRVVVDYVAGTSAGGLNGALLATAIGRGAPLLEIKNLWLESARLTEEALLLPSDKAGTALLDGPFFEAKIRETLEAIVPAPSAEAAEVTLLVTATALTGPRLAVEDAHDHAFRVSDRRRVYKFESAGRSADGVSTFENSDLARAARASASFPAAFEPVRETPELSVRRVDNWSAQARTRHAGVSASPGSGTSWLIDGGVLDNAPFEPLLDEMTRNPRADRGPRWVVYVVPSSPGLAGTSARGDRKRDAPTEPPAWFAVLKNLMGIKGEVDLRADIEALQRLQQEARSTHQNPEVLIAQPPLISAKNMIGLLPAYQRTRARGFAQFYREATANAEKLKQIELTESSINDLVSLPAHFIPSDLCPTRNGQWQWGTTVAKRLALWMSRDARLRAADATAIQDLAAAEKTLDRLHQRMTTTLVSGRNPGRRAPVNALLSRTDDIDRVLAELWPAISGAVEVWARTFSQPKLSTQAAWDRLLSTEVILNFARWQRQPSLPEFDVVLVDTGAPQMPITVAPDHPDLRQKLENRPDDKLYGTSLGHFGAFGRAVYRSHDWAWGRVDGAICLANALLQGVEASVKTKLRDDLVREILIDEGLATADNYSLETLRANTRDAFNLTPTNLIVESLKRGEIEISPAVEALERAIDLWAEQSPVGPAVDAITDLMADTLQAADGIARVVNRIRQGLQSAADKAGRAISRIWR